MTLLNVFRAPTWAWLAVDSAMYLYPPGAMDGTVSSDPAVIEAALAARRAMPAGAPLRRLLDVEKFVVGAGRRVVTAGSGHVEPTADWFNEVRAWEGTPTLDALAAEAPRRLARLMAGYPADAVLAVVVLGWSEAAREVQGLLLSSAAGFEPVAIENYYFSPFPDGDDPEADALYDMIGEPAVSLRDPARAHVLLAENQVRAYRRGVYGTGMAGGRLWCARVTESGVEVDVLAGIA